jgi:endonuclease YncB( thermonuclease family)
MFAALLLMSAACDFPPEDFEILYQDWCDVSRREVVECVYDGDTFYTGGCGGDSDEAFRMLGIQAPELSSPDRPEPDCYGQEATDLLKELILNQQIRMEFDVECTDIYQRTLAWVFIEDPSPATITRIEQLGGFGTVGTGGDTESDLTSVREVLINEVIIRAGYATIYRSDIAKNIRYTERLEVAEEEAEAQGRGLWSACD